MPPKRSTKKVTESPNTKFRFYCDEKFYVDQAEDSAAHSVIARVADEDGGFNVWQVDLEASLPIIQACSERLSSYGIKHDADLPLELPPAFKAEIIRSHECPENVIDYLNGAYDDDYRVLVKGERDLGVRVGMGHLVMTDANDEITGYVGLMFREQMQAEGVIEVLPPCVGFDGSSAASKKKLTDKLKVLVKNGLLWKGRKFSKVTNIKAVAACREDQVRNPKTRKCVKKCKEGQVRNKDTFKCETIKVAKAPKVPKGTGAPKGKVGASQGFTYTYYYSENRLYNEDASEAPPAEDIVRIMTGNGAAKSIDVKSMASSDFARDVDQVQNSDLSSSVKGRIDNRGGAGGQDVEHFFIKKDGVVVGVQCIWWVDKQEDEDLGVDIAKPAMTSTAPSNAAGELVAKMKHLIGSVVLCNGRPLKKSNITYM
uniref:Uncharacterized protein n=1 Tax=viral metagenome TaxID=1070528 RepID=A0A6C0I3R5_9ZZZZ